MTNEITNRFARICFDEREKMLYVTALPNVVLDLQTAEEHFRMIHELTRGKEHYALIDSTNQYTATPEAIEYAANPDTLKGRKAAAYFHPNLANRFQIMQVQIKLKAAIPSCAFKEKDEALLWLRSLNLLHKS